MKNYQYEGDFEDMESDFWAFWADIVAYAHRIGVTTEYVEEEFVIEGELITVELEEEPA